MGSRRHSARVKGWLGIVAVLSNVLASILCMAPVRSLVAVDDASGPIILCTEHGPQVLPGSDPAGGGGEDQRDGKSHHCIACTLLAGLALVVALVFTAIAFPVRIVHPFQSAARTLADHLSLGGIRSRAPPLSA
jgi:DUF2946 family protein